MIFRTNAGMYMSVDGKAFNRQYYTHTSLGNRSASPSYFYTRANVGGIDAFWYGSEPPGGTDETVFKNTDGTSPLVTAPANALVGVNVQGSFGTATAQTVTSGAMNPDGDTLYLMSNTGLLAPNTTNTGTFDTHIDNSSLIPGTTAIAIGSINDFGKMYMAVEGSGTDDTNTWLESTDGASWAVSTDPTLTAIAVPKAASTGDRTLKKCDWDADTKMPTAVCGVHCRSVSPSSLYDVWIPVA